VANMNSSFNLNLFFLLVSEIDFNTSSKFHLLRLRFMLDDSKCSTECTLNLKCQSFALRYPSYLLDVIFISKREIFK